VTGARRGYARAVTCAIDTWSISFTFAACFMAVIGSVP
jgi:hypothetical protein